ncbi:MAG: hypothetical protein WD270_02985, partial [Acetobacterales bacterium]
MGPRNTCAGDELGWQAGHQTASRGRMTPAARLAAAAEIYAEIMAGAQPADRILHNWAKGRRYAGAGDRRRIRALVYDTLRDRARLRWELRGPAWDATAPGDRLDVFAAYGLAPEELDAP